MELCNESYERRIERETCVIRMAAAADEEKHLEKVQNCLHDALKKVWMLTENNWCYTASRVLYVYVVHSTRVDRCTDYHHHLTQKKNTTNVRLLIAHTYTHSHSQLSEIDCMVTSATRESGADAEKTLCVPSITP